MGAINERLDSLRQLVLSQEFLEGKGLSKEVNIRIFCYDPKDEMAARRFIEKLTAASGLPCRLIEYNLYKIFLAVCDDRGITDKIPALEEKKGKAFILEQLRNAAGGKDFVRKMLETPRGPGDVILITGVGEAFPFIRVHALLEAMQPHFSDAPILVMYPGTFDGRSVKLFDRLAANPYYRAFNAV